MKENSMIDSLIDAIQSDQKLLSEVEVNISKSKEEKRRIQERLRLGKNDMLVLLKYLDDSQKERVESLDLNLDVSFSRKELNGVAKAAFELILEHKDYKMSNQQWYEAYLKSKGKDAEHISYTDFNIKCRSLFNSQKLIRTKGKDPKSSKDDVISLNGRPVNSKTPKETKVSKE